VRRKASLFAGIAGLLCVVMAWFWLRGPTGAISDVSTASNESVPVMASTAASPTAATDLARTPSGSEIENRKERLINAAFLTPISIFGKVVDEQNRAIPDAMVQISVNDSPGRSGTEYVRSTDTAGLFSLIGAKGISFSLRASKSGFYTTKESTAHRNVIAPGANDAQTSSYENPVTLTLRSKRHPEVLIHVSSRQVDIALRGPTIFDLLTGHVGNGQLHIVSVLGDTNRPRFDWSYKISIPGGGLVERKGQFEFEAPADHYSQDVQILMTSEQPRWSSDVTKEYFARLPDGRFGRFSINLYPGKRNFVVIESYVNPKPGNRNLEFDSDMPSSQ